MTTDADGGLLREDRRRAALRALESGGPARELPYRPHQRSDVVALTSTEATFENEI
jgi:hypothetical protein